METKDLTLKEKKMNFLEETFGASKALKYRSEFDKYTQKQFDLSGSDLEYITEKYLNIFRQAYFEVQEIQKEVIKNLQTTD
jgi:hypothetical protein